MDSQIEAYVKGFDRAGMDRTLCDAATVERLSGMEAPVGLGHAFTLVVVNTAEGRPVGIVAGLGGEESQYPMVELLEAAQVAAWQGSVARRAAASLVEGDVMALAAPNYLGGEFALVDGSLYGLEPLAFLPDEGE